MTADQYGPLTHGATVLSRDRHGDKVLQLADGRVLKLFRRKRRFSSSLFRPYARRFADAANRLAQLNIPAVKVHEVRRVPHIQRDIVIYDFLPGRTLREAATEDAKLMEPMARFLAQLHAGGVYFRAIHLGNVLLLPDGRLGLIDLSEARFRRGPLPVGLRVRNFKPLMRYPEDSAALQSFGLGRFLDCYLAASSLSAARGMVLRRQIMEK